ncbi:Tat pathway signal protein [Roseomonas sp. E05]|uniref:Tat pathway signal protein n=1 Tax=Roseomonas sp. E05 TaxID=3046310 RepID=UPI0024BAA13C|nr:Tat pathway signal protein [Roseomonas sp. E05]MDJ0389861.1 Tat pathway signal protein [Roseomonas sp. E05]
MRGITGTLSLLTALLLHAPAQAQSPADAVGLELNRLQPQGEGCRVWLVLRNAASAALDPLRLDLLVFGKDGVISRRLALDVGPLPAEKTTARVFDLSGQDCGGIGSLLLNDLLACGPAPNGGSACLPRLALSSRVEGVPFEK